MGLGWVFIGACIQDVWKGRRSLDGPKDWFYLPTLSTLYVLWRKRGGEKGERCLEDSERRGIALAGIGEGKELSTAPPDRDNGLDGIRRLDSILVRVTHLRSLHWMNQRC